jgi:hypothetical protein
MVGMASLSSKSGFVVLSGWVIDTPSSTERESHPVGTTVKVTHFFEYIPVRKQTATKNAAKCLEKIRRLMQAYALARPAVRFRLHVLKAKNNKGDFIYAPKASSNVEDAVLKVIGKECALQCEWTALQSEGFEIHAFLPKPTAKGPKIANHGAFISVDSRPVSNSRGTVKQVVAAFKEKLRRSSLCLTAVKDPFFCMNIICPPDSYDPNIEPAKDGVMFHDAKIILILVNRLLKLYYQKATVEVEAEPPTSVQQHVEPDVGGVLSEPRTSDPVHVMSSIETDGEPKSDQRSIEPRWRSSMYGIDEDDLEHLEDEQLLVIEEEEGRRAAEVSNPWTIARMNATIKPKAPLANTQLLSPAKSYGEMSIQPSSSSFATTPVQQAQAEPLTPQTSSRLKESASLSDRELEQSVRHVPSHNIHEQQAITTHDSQMDIVRHRLQFEPVTSGRIESEQAIDAPVTKHSRGRQFSMQTLSAPRTEQRKPASRHDVALAGPMEGPDDTWFGQPMRGSQAVKPSRRQKRRKEHGPPLFTSDIASSPRRPVLTVDDRMMGTRLYSENTTDIRNFFGSSEHSRAGDTTETPQRSSFTPTNPHSARNPPSRIVQGSFRPLNMGERPSSQPVSSRASSFAPRDTRDNLNMHAEDNTSSRSRNMYQQLGIYEDAPIRSPMPRPSSVGSARPPLVPIRSNQVRTALDLYGTDKLTQSSQDMATYFKAYQDRENIPPTRSAGPTRRQEPRVVPAHEFTSKTRPQRRRTTDGALRSKSSKLPLERVPHGYQIQNVVLPMRLSVTSIVQSSRKLDMKYNSLEYDYVVKNAFNAFAEWVSERTIMKWVMKLDFTLHEHFGQLPDVDTRSLLHEAIQRGLDERKSEVNMGIMEIADMPSLTQEVVEKLGGNNRETAKHGDQFIEASDQGPLLSILNDHPPGNLISAEQDYEASPRAEDQMSDFDMSQFVDWNAKLVENDAATSMPINKAEEDFGEDIEDDMLLDL